MSNIYCNLALLVALVMGLEAQATPAAPAQATSTTAPAKVLRNLAYGSDARQKFDVYLPAKPTGPVILFVHGGGWSRGDKASTEFAREKVAPWISNGYAVVSTNYPLHPKAQPMEQAAHVATAMAKVQKVAGDWGADPQRLVLVGEESGSHLVALITAIPSIAQKAGAQRWRASIAIDPAYMSPEEVMKAPHDKALDKVFGSTVAQWESLSPRHWLADGPPPPPLMMWCYKQRANSCELALHYERKAAKFKHQIVIWERHDQTKGGVQDLDVWLTAMVKP